MRYILVGGSPVDSFNASYIYQADDYFIGIDAGCDKLIDKGYKIDLAIGDFDTTKRFDEIKKQAKYVVVFNTM